MEDSNKLLRKIESKSANAKFACKQAQKESQEEPGWFSMLLVANIMIALSFMLLGVSFGMYYLSYRTEYLNYVIMGAVVLFVLGIMMRIISVMRE